MTTPRRPIEGSQEQSVDAFLAFADDVEVDDDDAKAIQARIVATMALPDDAEV